MRKYLVVIPVLVLIVVVGLTMHFKSKSTQEVIHLHDVLYEIKEEVDDKMNETEEVIMSYHNPDMFEESYYDKQLAMDEFIREKSKRVVEMKPKTKKGKEYYKHFTETIDSSMKLIELVIEHPDNINKGLEEESDEDIVNQMQKVEKQNLKFDKYLDEITNKNKKLKEELYY